MSYQPQDPAEHQEIIDLLEASIIQDKKCCDATMKYLNALTFQVNQNTIILRELLKCCKYMPVKPTNPIIPGQAIIEIQPRPQQPTTSRPTLPSTPPVYTTQPKGISYTDTPLRLYPVDKGYFGIIGIPGSWFVSNRRIINKSGEDLETKLPIYFNQWVCENKQVSRSWIAATGKNNIYYTKCLELVAIRGYVIKDTSQGKDTPLLIYETNSPDGVRRTFEASINLWIKYAK